MISGKSSKRLWVPKIELGALKLSKEYAHYVQRVLRLTEGAHLSLFDDSSYVGRAILQKSTSSEVILSVLECTERPLESLEVTVALAQPKDSRDEWVIEKLTELGANHIVWLDCERTQNIGKNEEKRTDRYKKIARSAAEQSGSRVPTFEGTIHWTTFCKRHFDLKLIALAEGEFELPSKLPSQRATAVIAIGPEGGFTSAEEAMAIENGFLRWGLSEQILRIETAALLSLGLVRHQFHCSSAS